MKTVQYSAFQLLSCAKCKGEAIICIDASLHAYSLPFLDVTVLSYTESLDSCGRAKYLYNFSYDENELLDSSYDLVEADIDGVFCRGCLTTYIDAVASGQGTYTPHRVVFTNSVGALDTHADLQWNNSTRRFVARGSIDISDDTRLYRYAGVDMLRLAKAGSTGYASTYLGYRAGSDNCIDSTCMGWQAGYEGNGESFTLVGFNAGFRAVGDSTTAVGRSASENSNCEFQTVVGDAAGREGTGDYQNAIGTWAGSFNSGIYQVAMGHYSGSRNVGSFQTALGHAAGHWNSGDYQTVVGSEAGGYSSGSHQVAIGHQAGKNNTANSLVAIGYQAGLNNTTANQFILKQTHVNATPLIQGDFSTGDVTIGNSIRSKYESSDGTAGATGSLPVGTVTTITVKDGIITGWS